MSSTTISTDQFLAAAKFRRTVYALKATSPVPDSRIEDIVKEVLSFAPSSYNTQSSRITLVLGDKHKQFWDIVIKESEGILKSAGAWDAMYPRFQAFQNAYGSVSSPSLMPTPSRCCPVVNCDPPSQPTELLSRNPAITC
jgi:predicted oxidoreductase (fatty acid repression mutant protein)